MLTSPDWTLTHPGRRGSLPCINVSTKSGKILPAECSPAPSLQFPAGSPQPSFQPDCYQKPAVKENGLLKYEGCRYAPSCVLHNVKRFTSSCVQLHWYRSIKLIMTHSWVMYVRPTLCKPEWWQSGWMCEGSCLAASLRSLPFPDSPLRPNPPSDPAERRSRDDTWSLTAHSRINVNVHMGQFLLNGNFCQNLTHTRYNWSIQTTQNLAFTPVSGWVSDRFILWRWLSHLPSLQACLNLN